MRLSKYFLSYYIIINNLLIKYTFYLILNSILVLNNKKKQKNFYKNFLYFL